jgi:tRNA uridine 5-carboxymethylaminomethyl modification enzyme
MFTSRAEYRLALREDNARDRLFGHARRLGLVSEEDFSEFRRLQANTECEIEKLSRTTVRVSELGSLSDRFKTTEHVSLGQLLKMPGVDLNDILPILARFNGQFSKDPKVLQRAAIEIRYEGYIAKQAREIEKFKKLERQTIPTSFTYQNIRGLRTEARQKFARYRPESLGQASRIEGVTPADIAVLSVHLKKHRSTA